jgi:tRNA splicing ligase
MKNGMIVIVGNTLAEVEADFNACKVAMSTGARMGCGGKTTEEVEKALLALAEAVGAKVELATPPCSCNCSCCVEEDEYDEDEYDYDEDEDVELIDLTNYSDADLLALISEATAELSTRA